MRSRVPLFALLFVTGLFVLPLAAYAQGIPFFGPIIPDGFQSCPAGWGMLITVINRIIAVLISIAIVFVAPLMIAYSGFLFVVNPVDSGGISKAKSILLHTIVGIVIALAGWMIVDAIMAVLYNSGARSGTTVLGTWSSIISSAGITNDCLQQVGAPIQTGRVPTPPPTVTVTPTVNCAASYAAVLPGIPVSSSGNCCDKTRRNCTSLDGMLSSTIQQIKNVKDKCGAITVTGGTEVGHSGEGSVGSHSGGSKVDLSQNLISCITGTTGRTLISSPSFGLAQVRDRCGNLYTWEGNHTDISVVSACSL